MVEKALLTSLFEPILQGMGFVLYGLEWASEEGRQILRVYVEKPEGLLVNVDECAKVSRQLSMVLEVEFGDKIQKAYWLEVSSPGMNRPLFSVDQVARVVGQEIKLTLTSREAGDRRQYRGTVQSVEASTGMVTVLQDGVLVPIDWSLVEKSRVVPNFSEALKKKQEAKNDE